MTHFFDCFSLFGAVLYFSFSFTSYLSSTTVRVVCNAGPSFVPKSPHKVHMVLCLAVCTMYGVVFAYLTFLKRLARASSFQTLSACGEDAGQFGQGKYVRGGIDGVAVVGEVGCDRHQNPVRFYPQLVLLL